MNYLTINEAARILPGRPHRNTVGRWMLKGLDGVKLRSFKFGAKRVTTQQWCAEFIKASANRDGVHTAHMEASAELDALDV